MEILNRLKLNTVKILSIDGGGVRGIFPAILLAHIEDELHALGRHRYIYEIFNIIAGTSSGGLIALGLSAPKDPQSSAHKREPIMTAGDLFDFYREKASVIFPNKRNNMGNRIIHAFRNKYDDKNLNALLQRIFGDLTLKDALTNILVTSYDTVNREPRFFKNRPAASDWGGADLNFYLRDVVRATVAAPTYFSPAFIRAVPDQGKSYSLIDGGVVANNPALSAYIEARKIYPNAMKYLVLSLGTGVVDKPYPYEEVKDWGYIDWMSSFRGLPLLDMIMDGQSDGVVHMLKRLPGVELDRYDFLLDENHTLMDDASTENMAYMEEKARAFISENRERIKTLCRKL